MSHPQKLMEIECTGHKVSAIKIPFDLNISMNRIIFSFKEKVMCTKGI